MGNKKTHTPEDLAPRAEHAKRAFERLVTKMVRLRSEELVTPKLDVSRAVAIALAAEPVIRRYLPDVKKHLPTFDATAIEELDDTALAAWYAHASVTRSEDEGAPIRELVEEALELRRDLFTQADALASRGHLDAERVAEIRAGRGNTDLAKDLVALQALFLERWDETQHKTLVTREELAHAADVGTRLLRALGARERPMKAEGAPDSAELRVRAFTLFLQRYDDVRRAISYLRWKEGDADEIAPSLYTGSRGGRRRSAEDRTTEDGASSEVPQGAPARIDGAATNDGAAPSAAPRAPGAPIR